MWEGRQAPVPPASFLQELLQPPAHLSFWRRRDANAWCSLVRAVAEVSGWLGGMGPRKGLPHRMEQGTAGNCAVSLRSGLLLLERSGNTQKGVRSLPRNMPVFCSLHPPPSFSVSHHLALGLSWAAFVPPSHPLSWVAFPGFALFGVWS